MTEYLMFYKYQILTGILAASVLSFAGVMLYLKKMSFFGITLSQAAALAAVILLSGEIHEPFLIIVLTLLLILPVYFFSRGKYPDAVLAGAFLFFTAMTQIVLSHAGAASNHLVQAFFGDILLVDTDQWTESAAFYLFIIFIYFLLYRKTAAVTFDKDQSTLDGLDPRVTDTLFMILLSVIISVSVRNLGSFHAPAFLIIPPAAAVVISRSLAAASVISVMIAASAVISGFLISIVPYGESEMHLPTSSMITVMTAVISGILYLISIFLRETE